MSYCRFAESSDVYAYECDGGVQFWVAGNADKGLNRLCGTFNDAYQYAKVLRDKYGLSVPDTAIEELRADAIEEVKRMNGVIEELYDENAKLRELVTDMLHDAMENVCSKAYWCDEKNWQTCNDEECGNRLYVEMARELGVEVNE